MTISNETVEMILNEIKNIANEAFLTGSYKFNRASNSSDVDIAILISSKQDVLKKYINLPSFSESHYNAGFKFLHPSIPIVVNIIPLHPLEFCCWSKTTKMLIASGSDFKKHDKQTFHAIHQLSVTLAKLSIREVVNTSNFQEHI